MRTCADCGRQVGQACNLNAKKDVRCSECRRVRKVMLQRAARLEARAKQRLTKQRRKR